MSSLTLTLRQPLDARFASASWDMRGIVPDKLTDLSVGEIAKLPILCQARKMCLEEVFQIADGPRNKLLLKGDLSRADNVGAGMRDGMLVVEGSVGNAVAADMRGGQLIVDGDAGDYAATGMRGGLVDIAGSVRDYCAGARPGARRGMRGGVVRVRNSAGRYLGYHMRRGTVIVAGQVGPGCANSMIAGTIVCCGELLAPLAIGMHRGTIISLSTKPLELHSGFTQPEKIRLSFLYLLLDALRSHLPNVDIDSLVKQPLWRSLGDRASGGKGELLWMVADDSAEA